MSFFKNCLLLLSALILVSGAVAQDNTGAINLVFTGSGNRLASQSSIENKYNSKTKKFESGYAVNTGRQPFNGSGNVEIHAPNFGRIKIPSPMIGLLNNGDDGWFTISNLQISDQEITGAIVINGLNKPKLRIDRNTGFITINGNWSEFTGQCEVVRTGTAYRKF